MPLATLAGLLLCLLEVEIHGMKHPALSPDAKRIAFSYHGDIWVCSREGGLAQRITTDPAHEQKPAWSPNGRKLAFSSNTFGNYDLFLYDLQDETVTQLTFHSSDDDAPAWSPDGQWIAFQSNRDSNVDLPLNNSVFDIWKMSVTGGTAIRITCFRGENPAWSGDGKWMAYDRYSSGYGDGEHNIFIIPADGRGPPRELAGGMEDSRHPVFAGDTLYFAHGRNLWKTRIEGGALAQVTGLAENSITWPTVAAEYDLLLFELEFDLYTLFLSQKALHPRRLKITTDFSYPDETVRTETVTSGAHQPKWSPSGRLIVAALAGDLWLFSAEGGNATPLTHDRDEQRDPSWTSDGKEIVYVSKGDIYRLPLKGPPRRLTSITGNYRTPRLSKDGKTLAFVQGEDLFLLDLDSGASRPFSAEPGTHESSPVFSPDGTELAWISAMERNGTLESKIVVRKLDGGAERTYALSSRIHSDLAWSPDGRHLAFTVRKDDRTNIHLFNLKEEKEKAIPSERGVSRRSPSWSPDSSMLVFEAFSNERHSSLEVCDAVRLDDRVRIAFRAVRQVSHREERRALFFQVWEMVNTHYYDPFFHGADWPALREKYGVLAAECFTQVELHDLINDMIRELHSSHVHLVSPAPKNKVSTGFLGADLSWTQEGFSEISAVEPDGPAAQAGIWPGEILVGVGTEDLAPDFDLDEKVTVKSGESFNSLKLRIRSIRGEEREVSVEPISRTQLRDLKYRNLIQRREDLVRERSDGRLGYIHIRYMGTPEVQRLTRAIREHSGAEGLIVDIRDGVGGMAHRPMINLLDSKAWRRVNRHPLCYVRNRNGTTAPDKFSKPSGPSWNKPVIVVQNEVSRSDKEIFSYTFRQAGIGYLVGMPTAGGVIGGSDVVLRDGSRITVSTQGWFTAEGRNMEGWGVPPDFRVPETHEDLYAGRDPQLEKAIEILLAQIEGRIALRAPSRSSVLPKGDY